MALADRITFTDVYLSIPRLTKVANTMDDMPEVLVKRGVIKRDYSLQKYALTSTDAKIHYDAPLLRNSANVVNYDATLTNTIECVDQTMIVIGRKFSFSSNFFADLLMRSDDEGNIAKYLNQYWQKIKRQTLVKSLTGSMAIPAMTNLTSNISTGSTIGNANRLTKNNIAMSIQSKFTNWKSAKVMVVHSVQFAHMIQLGSVDYLYDPLYGRIMPKVLGMDILIDDTVATATNSTYTSYILGNESIVCAEAKESTPFAIVDDTGNREYLVTKKRYIAQPIGLSFTGTPAGASPTDAELATSENWALDYASESYVLIIRVIANADLSLSS